MNDLTRKHQFVRELANQLNVTGKTLDAQALSEKLNAAGHLTTLEKK